MAEQTIIPALVKGRQKEQKFKAIFWFHSLRTVWASETPSQEKKKVGAYVGEEFDTFSWNSSSIYHLLRVSN